MDQLYKRLTTDKNFYEGVEGGFYPIAKQLNGLGSV